MRPNVFQKSFLQGDALHDVGLLLVCRFGASAFFILAVLRLISMTAAALVCSVIDEGLSHG